MVGILGFLILLRVGLWEQIALFSVYFGIITNLVTFIYNYLSNSCSIDLITFSLLLSSLIMTDEWAVNPVCSVACDDNKTL